MAPARVAEKVSGAMNTFPSIPGWDGIHPAMVHFPIALFLVAPILLLVSLLARQAWRTWAGAALVVMVLGTIAAWLTVASGHAAGQIVDKTQDLAREIGRHEALGVTTRNLFTVLTGVFAALMLLPAVLRRSLPLAARVSLHLVFLVVYSGGTLVLANAASQGGRLVHALGVRAMIEQPREQVNQPQVGVVTSPRLLEEVKAK
jgi:uncharacterized membrane protein